MNVQLETRLGFGLAAVCAMLALAVLALWVGVGRGYGWLEPTTGKSPPLPSVKDLRAGNFEMPPYGKFAEITQRPLFSEDRKPIPPDALAAEAEPAAPPTAPLQVILTGVIITPKVQLAMFHDNTTNKSVSLKEGMPLPGNQSGWTLVEIQPRKVVFTDPADKTQEVELKVAGSTGSPSKHAPARPAVQQGTLVKDNAQTAAERLRERIEERRRELREKAEAARKAAADKRQNADAKR